MGRAIWRIGAEALLTLALCGIGFNACAFSRIAQPEVLTVDGEPCFTVSASDLQRDPGLRLSSISVSAAATPAVDVWLMVFEMDQAPVITASDCVIYGRPPPGARPAMAEPLRTGVLYEVSLNVRPSKPDATAGYVGKFCLIQSGKERRVVQVRPGTDAYRERRCPQ